MGEKFPEAWSHLVGAANHVADRAWTGMANFLTGQSVLVLAWATMLAAPNAVGRGLVMLGVCLVGMATGFMWALLSTRMWHYHLEYVYRMQKLWETFRESEQGQGALGWREVDVEGDVLDLLEIRGGMHPSI